MASAGEGGFISTKHSQEVRFGIVRPIPAFLRKLHIKSNWKTPKDISRVASRLERSVWTWPEHGLFLHLDPKAEPYKEPGTMEGSTNTQARRLTRMAAALCAHAPDEHMLSG